MLIFSKIMRGTVKVEKTLIGICLLLATSIIVYNVIARRLGAAPQWGEEAVRYLMIWITFIGSALCFRRSSHFGIDVIRRVPSALFQKCVTIFILLAAAVFAGLLFFYGLRFTSFVISSGQKTAALGWPIYLVYSSVPIGSVLTIIHLIEVFLSDVLGIYTPQE